MAAAARARRCAAPRRGAAAAACGLPCGWGWRLGAWAGGAGGRGPGCGRRSGRRQGAATLGRSSGGARAAIACGVGWGTWRACWGCVGFTQVPATLAGAWPLRAAAPAVSPFLLAALRSTCMTCMFRSVCWAAAVSACGGFRAVCCGGACATVMFFWLSWTVGSGRSFWRGRAGWGRVCLQWVRRARSVGAGRVGRVMGPLYSSTPCAQRLPCVCCRVPLQVARSSVLVTCCHGGLIGLRAAAGCAVSRGLTRPL
jgi:hypothetical protein